MASGNKKDVVERAKRILNGESGRNSASGSTSSSSGTSTKKSSLQVRAQNILKTNQTPDKYRDASEYPRLMEDDLRQYSGDANADTAYAGGQKIDSALEGIYGRDAGSSISKSGVLHTFPDVTDTALLAMKQIEEGKDYFTPDWYASASSNAAEALASGSTENYYRLQARSGHAWVLDQTRRDIERLKEEGAQPKNWWQKIFGGTTYSNQDEIDAGEKNYQDFVNLLKLAGMDKMTRQIDGNGIRNIVQRHLNYPEVQFNADWSLVYGVLTTGYGKDDPEFPKALQRLESYTGENPRRITAHEDIRQWMADVSAQYDANLAKIDAFIDGNSAAAGTEYDFDAEQYLSYQQDLAIMEQQAEADRQRELEMMGRMADIHAGLVSADDYAENSQYIKGGDYVKIEYDIGLVDADFGSMLNDLVNAAGTSQYDQKIREMEDVPDGYGAFALQWQNSIRYMSEEDKQDFFYVYNTKGRRAAEQFLYDISWKLNKQYEEEALPQLQAKVSESPVNAALYSIGSVGEQFMGYLASASVGVSKLWGQEVHEYDPRFFWGKRVDVIRGTTGSMIEEATPEIEILGQNVGKMLYNGVMSAADSFASTALFGYGAVPMMASGTFGRSYQENLAAMGDTPDALMDAVVDGVIEAATEYISVEGLLDDSVRSGFKALLRQALIEPSEEVMGELLRTAYDAAKYGENNKLRLRMAELRTMGYSPSEAEKIAAGEFMSGLAETILTSMVSGAAGGAGNAVRNTAANVSTGRTLQRNATEPDIESFLAVAGTLNLTGEAKRFYDSMSAQWEQQQSAAQEPQAAAAKAAPEAKSAAGTDPEAKVASGTEPAAKAAAKADPAAESAAKAEQEAESAAKAAPEAKLAAKAEPGATEISEPESKSATEAATTQTSQTAQRVKKPLSAAKLGLLYRETMRQLDTAAGDALRQNVGFNVAKELARQGVRGEEAKRLAESILRIQDGSFTPEDVEAVSMSSAARKVLTDWTATERNVNEALGRRNTVASMLTEKRAYSETGTANGVRPEAQEANQDAPEEESMSSLNDEFDATAAVVQAQYANALTSDSEASTLDGEAVEVLGIDSAQAADGEVPKVKVRTAAGEERSVNAERIAYGANDENTFKLAAYAGEYGRNGDLLYSAYQSGQDVDEYARAFHRAAQYGADGRNLNVLMGSEDVRALSPEQINTAYEVGRAMRAQQTQARYSEMRAPTETGTVDVSGVNVASLNRQQRASVDVMRKLAPALGVNVRFVESMANAEGRYTTENGSYDPRSRTLTLDIHAGSNFANDTNYAVMQTAGHELTHYIRQFADSALWDEYSDFVVQHLDSKLNLDAEIAKRMQLDSGLTREAAIEEIVADASGEALSRLTETQLQELAQENPTLLKKIARFMKKWISNLKRQIELAFKGTEAKTEVARQMQDALDEMAEMWNGLLVEAGRNANVSGSSAVSGVEIDTESQTATIKDSRRSLEDSEYAKNPDKMAAALAKAIDVSEAQARRYLKNMFSIAKIIAGDQTRLDYEGNPLNSVLKDNAEYRFTVDMSTLCAKRLVYTGTLDAIQKAMPNTVLTSEDLCELRKLMMDRGYEVACGICYVESRRRELGSITKGFVDLYNEALAKGEDMMLGPKNNRQAFPTEGGNMLTLADVNTTEGIENIQLHHPKIYAAYMKYMNSRGVSKPKLIETRTDYRGEILQLFNTKRAVNDRNENGGLRIQSFSDFEVVHLIDMMQVITDMAQVGLSGQAYTKVPNFAEAMGRTGLKINLSLIAKDEGVDADGNLIFDGIEGMPAEEAFRLRKKYSKNVGTILVGKSDAHIRAALADPRIDFVIPFHKSGWSESLYEKLGLKNYSDYTNFQNERPVTDSSFKWDHSKSASENYAAINKIRDKLRHIDNFLPMDYWDFSLSGEENARNYLEACYYDGRIPKFPQFVNEPGYWKLLIDFKMYDNNGVGSPQLPVKPDFNMTQARRMLKEYDGGHAKLPVAQDVVDDFVKQYNASEFADDSDVKYSGRYDYDTLVAKPDMHITMLDNVDGIDRREAYKRGRENVMQYAERFDTNGTPMMYVPDLEKYVVVGRKALEHGLDRRVNKQGAVVSRIGDILNNSIVINEADPKKAGVRNSWILLGAAMDGNDRLIYVRSVVNQSTLEVDDVSALYAVYGKTKEAGRVVAPEARTNGSGTPSNLTISIADLLKGVKGLFDDVISEDVADRLGIERSESEFTERLRYQQRDPDQISDRELLATALQSVTQNGDEWDNLRRYQKKVQALDEKQRKLEAANARIRELTAQNSRANRDEIIRLTNIAGNYARQIDRADKELLKIEAMKPIQKLAERQREDYRQRLKAQTEARMRRYRERLREDTRDRIRDVRERMREQGAARTRKAVEHAREVGQRRVDRLKESEAKAKYKTRLQKDVSTMREWLTQPTNKGHVPQFLRAPLADFLESLDFTSVRALNGGDSTQADARMLEKMDALRRALAHTREQQAGIENGEAAFRGYLDIPVGLVDQFDEAIASIKQTLAQAGNEPPINRMSGAQLKELSDMVRTINTAVRKMNRFLANRRYQRISDAAMATIKTLEKLGPRASRSDVLNRAGAFLDWTNATPYYAFKRFGDGGRAVFEGLMDGWDRLAFNSKELIDYANSAYTTKQVREWSREVHTIRLNGEDIQMTTAQIMSLYCLNRREQARGHLLGGGMRIADFKIKGNTVSQVDDYTLTETDIAGITKLLTPEQRTVADKLQDFMNTRITEWGNEVSMQRFGYEAFGDEANYFPIETDRNNLKAIDENAQENSMFRLLNLSATKSTIKNANNALVVRDIFDVFSAHGADMAKYNALALPILDALKWYNYVGKTNYDDGSLDTDSVQKALEKAYGKDAQNYIKNFLRDLNGVREGGRNDGPLNAIISNYKIASVAANLRVGLLQITSMPRAAYAISPKYLAAGVAKNIAFRNSALAEKNVGISLWKSLGFYDTNISRNIREMVKHDQSIGGRIKDKSMILAEKGDAWTMGVLYGAVEAEMADKHANVQKGSDAYRKMVNDRMREIIYQTQVVDSTMTRSDLMRDTRGKMAMVTAFMSEPTLTMNMLADSIFEQRMKARESGRKLIAPSAKMVKGFAVSAVTLTFSAIMEAAFTAWRDDDEYETFGEKYSETFVDTLLENLNLLNNIPIVKDALEAIQGGSATRMDNAWIATLWQGLTEVYKYLNGESNNPPYNGIYKTVSGLSQMSGFAVGGLTRELVSLYNNVIAAPMGYSRIQTYEDSASDAAKAILNARMDGDTNLEAHYAGLAEQHGIDAEKLGRAMQTATGEAYVAGTIDADAAEELLGAYVGKTEAEIADQLTKWDYERETGLKYGNMKDDYISGTVDRETVIDYYGEESISRWDYERETGLAYDDMRDDYLSDRISASQAREYLMTYGGKTDEKAQEQLDRWDYYAVTGDSEGYTKYWRMYYAFENGGDFRRYASEWIDAGVKKSYIASSIAGRYKEEYLAIKGTAAGDAMLEHLLDLYEAIGYDGACGRNYINNKWTPN